jgi:hypothetical protein
VVSIARILFARFRALRAIGTRMIVLRYCAVLRERRSRDRNSAFSKTFMAIARPRGEETLAVYFGILDSERLVAGKGRSPKFN